MAHNCEYLGEYDPKGTLVDPSVLHTDITLRKTLHFSKSLGNENSLYKVCFPKAIDSVKHL